VHHPGEPGGREDERCRRGLPEDRRRTVDRGNVPEHLRLELDPGICLPGTAQRQLLTSGAVGVVEHRSGRPPSSPQSQIGYRRDACQPTCGGVEFHSPRTKQGLQLGPTRPLSGGHPRVVHDGSRRGKHTRHRRGSGRARRPGNSGLRPLRWSVAAARRARRTGAARSATAVLDDGSARAEHPPQTARGVESLTGRLTG